VVGVPHADVVGMMGAMLSSGQTLMDLLVEQILVQYGAGG